MTVALPFCVTEAMDAGWVRSHCIANFCLQTLMLNQTEPKTLASFSFPFFSTLFFLKNGFSNTVRKILAEG